MHGMSACEVPLSAPEQVLHGAAEGGVLAQAHLREPRLNVGVPEQLLRGPPVQQHQRQPLWDIQLVRSAPLQPARQSSPAVSARRHQ